MVFRATLFSAFGASKRWLGTNSDGTTRALTDIDYFKVRRRPAGAWCANLRRWRTPVDHPSGLLTLLTRSLPLQAGFITGFAAAFAEGPIDFYKSQIQVQIIRSKSDPSYKRTCRDLHCAVS